MPRTPRKPPLPQESSLYEYPLHLREALQDMPAKAGVYTFHAAEGTLPLYIGKSVNLRARLLSHLRKPQEARLLRQTAHISHIRTAGELGALLLEAQLIKQQQPLFNQKLRRNRQLCSLRLMQSEPSVVYAQVVDFARTPELYGLFSSRIAALNSLRSLADEHGLCLGVMSLEPLAAGRACFRAMLKQCRGACCGQESLSEHANRLRQALQTWQLTTWPYTGAIGLEERDDDLRQIHVVRNWCYLGSASTLPQARKLAQVTADFDADGYKILCGPLLKSQANEDLGEPDPVLPRILLLD